MAQKVVGLIKLQIPAGKATPAPPVGPALGQHGVNIVAFTKEFNDRTKNDAGLIIPVVITVYEDRSFTFITKTPPAAVLIKKACGIDKASGVPNKNKVATISKADGFAKVSAKKRGYSPCKNLLIEIDKRYLTYRGLSRLTGISKSALPLKMSGKVKFTAEEKLKLIEIFNKPIEYLLFKEEL